MSQRVKKSSLKPEERAARRIRALRQFRAIVRLVIANMYWLGDIEEQTIGENVMKNIQLLTRKKIKKSSLTLQEKAILNKPKEARTEEEKSILNRAIGGLKCFRKYPPDVKSQLAAVTYFTYIGPGRLVVKQNHLPKAMYFMLSGEAVVTVRKFDKVFNEWIDVESGIIGPGTMFGEVALLHNIVRLATITTTTPCELLCIKKEDFDLVLRDTVWKAWEEITKIMNKFSYFKNWDSVTKRECSIMSRTKVYAAEELVLGDDVGLPHYVYFITKGVCYIIEHLILKVRYVKGVKKYEIFKIEETDETETSTEDTRLSKLLQKYLGDNKDNTSEIDTHKSVTFPDGVGSVGRYDFNDMGRKSTLSGLTVSKSESLGQLPNKFLDYDLETHFIKVCELLEGACFNIGESFQRRRVVAKCPTHCLLVPRYWILRNNKDNIWNRVQQFLNQRIPTTEEIFKRFLQEKKFLKYRKSLIRDLLAEKKVSNNNSIHNVPYSIRLKEGVDVNYDL